MSSPIDTSPSTETVPALTLEMLADSAEQPGWRVLDTARAQRFTGEIVFETSPTVSVYFDDGLAYYAASPGDPSLCSRLVDSGVVEQSQLERGVIRIGDVANLGRLFDRDPSVDRDAVMVVLELSTDDVVTAVANSVTSSFTATAYRHHVSGIHRWFVPSAEHGKHAPEQFGSVGDVAHLDTSVTNDLPRLGDTVDDGVEIEWDQPLDDDLASEPTPLHSFDDSMLRSLFDSDVAESSASPASQAEHESRSGDGNTANSFHIVWPDGSEQTLLGPDGNDVDPAVAGNGSLTIESSEPEIAPVTPITSDLATEAVFAAPVDEPSVDESLVDEVTNHTVIVPADELVAPVPEPEPESEPDADADADVDVDVDAAPLTFELPTLAVDDHDRPDDHQPEEVVDAVRRALEAIEAASAKPTMLPSVAIDDLPSFEPTAPLRFDAVEPLVLEDRDDAPVDPVDEVGTEQVLEASTAATDPTGGSALEAALSPQVDQAEVVDPVDVVVDVVPAPAEPAPAPFAGFAPPTMQDSAEAVYARAAAAESATAGPASGVASVVFVDEDPGERDDRTSSLKRLIGSLRRK